MTNGSKACSIDGCEKPARARGWCATHWARWRANGSPEDSALRQFPAGTPIHVRFWAKVSAPTPFGCWEWTAHTERGYGVIFVSTPYGERKIRAHRFAYEWAIGPIPDDNVVCHACDNPRCVNPEHLWLGSHHDNAADRHRKQRSHKRPGELNPAAKLTEDDIRSIRADARPDAEIAHDYGISRSAVSAIQRRARWKHVV